MGAIYDQGSLVRHEMLQKSCDCSYHVAQKLFCPYYTESYSYARKLAHEPCRSWDATTVSAAISIWSRRTRCSLAIKHVWPAMHVVICSNYSCSLHSISSHSDSRSFHLQAQIGLSLVRSANARSESAPRFSGHMRVQ